ncbi:uncharacterized protein J3R85_003101 [Psidium guajava]|nr:uncharacterized protein J3R85_003101 [Psidium guajava]
MFILLAPATCHDTRVDEKVKEINHDLAPHAFHRSPENYSHGRDGCYGDASSDITREKHRSGGGQRSRKRRRTGVCLEAMRETRKTE